MTKKEKRDLFLKIRGSISGSEKINFDNIIFTRFINSSFFNCFDTFLVYISFGSEVSTIGIINFLLNKNKKVAVPYCSGNEMSFYYINSLDDLIEGRFRIPSVNVNKAKKVENFYNTLCIVPGVSFDNNGNRLGYGGGYYDRFLSGNKLVTLGLCYERCISDSIPSESFDIKMDYVLTETCLRNHK